MKDGARRSLSPGERKLAREVFGDGLELDGVVVRQLPGLMFHACVPWRDQIVFAKWRAAMDFWGAGTREQAWFIHELAHVWQAQKGVVLPLAKLKATGNSAYRIDPDKAFFELNIEAQAEVARGAFLIKRGYVEPELPAPARLLELWNEALG